MMITSIGNSMMDSRSSSKLKAQAQAQAQRQLFAFFLFFFMFLQFTELRPASYRHELGANKNGIHRNLQARALDFSRVLCFFLL